jgi:hypoxanthine phosphoribosyltransferase
MCVLLRKPAWRRKAQIETAYVGFDIPDEFVVGYGLDYDGFYRNHPAVAVLKPKAV